MGCWNGTCGLTHLPIFAGDQIACVLIQRNGGDDASGYCYIDDAWAPVSILFHAEYDDYGGAENIHISPQAETVLREYLRDNVVVPERQDSYYGAITAETIMSVDFEDLVRWAERDLLVVRGYDRRTPQQVGLWMCHLGAFEAAAKAYKYGSYYVRKYGYANLHYNKLPQAFDEWVALCMQALHVDGDVLRPHVVDFQIEEHLTLVSASGEANRQTGRKRYLRDLTYKILSRGEFGTGNMTARFVGTYLKLLREGIPLESLQTLKMEIVEKVMLLDVLSDARIGFYPQTGKGSQNDDMRCHRALASFVVSKDRERKAYMRQYR